MSLERFRLDGEVEVELELEVGLDSLKFVRLLVTYLIQHDGSVRVFHLGSENDMVMKLHSRTIGAVANGQLVLLEVEAVVVQVLGLLECVLVRRELSKNAGGEKQC